MQRITSADDAVLDLNGHYIFAQSNPPLPDTILTATWANSIQEEIATVIEASGQTLDVASNRQLLDALKSIDAIATNTTLTVNNAAPYPKLQDAYAFLRGRYILPGVSVTIQLQTGMAHTLTTPVLVTHPQGDQIEIKGDTTTPVVVTCTPTGWSREAAAITVRSGGKIKIISGITFEYDVANAITIPVYCIKAQQSGTIALGLKLTVNNFRGAGILAEDGGVITGVSAKVSNTNTTGFVTGTDPTYFGAGFWARRLGILRLTTCDSQSNYKFNYLAESAGSVFLYTCTGKTGSFGARDGGYLQGDTCESLGVNPNNGFDCRSASTMKLMNCVGGKSGAGNNCYTGYFVSQGSRMFVDSCSASYNVVNGFDAQYSSSMYLNNSVAYNNGTNGIQAVFGSMISGENNIVSSNATGAKAAAFSSITGNTYSITGNTVDLDPATNPAASSRIQ